MFRFCLAVIVSAFIIIPYTANAFFIQNLTAITVVRNITCQLDDNGTSASDFQLCAIRVYQGSAAASVSTFSLYNGFRYVNIFRRFIQMRCSNPDALLTSDTGIWKCNLMQQSFESFASMQLCICATNNCNQNFSSCQQSAGNTINISLLINLMPALNQNSTFECNDTLNASNTCGENPYINVPLCQEYVRNNSVLCAISIDGTITTQTSLVYDNYEPFLDESIYQARSVLNTMTGSSFNETGTNVYYKYFPNDIASVEECACASYSLCNQNINTCLTQTALQIGTITPTSSFTEISFATFIAPNSSSTGITTTTTTSTDSTTTTGFTDSTTTTGFTDSTTTTGFTDSTTTTGSAGSTTTITSTDSTTTTGFTDSTTTTGFTDSTTTTGFTDSTTTTGFTDSTTATGSAGSTTTITSTDSTTTTGSTDSTTTTGLIDSTTTTGSAGSTTTATPTGSTTTATPTSSITSTTSTNSNIAISTSTTTTQSSTVTSSLVQQNLVTGEKGLGSAATAGIACGIIFSVVVVAAEIAFFKFFYKGNFASSFERSVAYRA